MYRFYWSTLLSLTAILVSLVNPVFAAQEGKFVASAVIVPAQVTELGFVTSALIKEITVKEGEQVQAGQTLAALDIPELRFAVIAAEAALRSAQAEEKVQSYRRIKDRRNGRVFFDVVPPEVRQIAHARVQQAQAALEVSQATLAQTRLVAPHDATVVSVNVIRGEYVEQNQVVLILATLNTLQVETTDLSERDITKVKIGDPANILVEALNADIAGKVISISPIANTLGGDVIFTVTVSLDEQLNDLLWGMTAEVMIGE